MRKTLTLLVATTALTAAIGLPAWSAMHTPANTGPAPFAAVFDDAAQTLPLILASDGDDDKDRHDRNSSRRGHDDDDEEEEEDDCDAEEDDDCRSGAGNPAPAGTVAPPQNGLFGNGTPPQVKVN
ncbi:MAG: hypothetical protein GW905_01670 [Rhodobacterales bacterium]|nr:hypothetical protein [Rhodobacterales bacterium]